MSENNLQAAGPQELSSADIDTVFPPAPSDERIPSTKLVKDSLDQKVNKAGDTLDGGLTLTTLHTDGEKQYAGMFVFEPIVEANHDDQVRIHAFNNLVDRDNFDWEKGNSLVFPTTKVTGKHIYWQFPQKSGILLSTDGDFIKGSVKAEFAFNAGDSGVKRTLTLTGATTKDLIVVTGVYVVGSDVDQQVIHVNSWHLVQGDKDSSVELTLGAFLLSSPLTVTGQVDYVVIKNMWTIWPY